LVTLFRGVQYFRFAFYFSWPSHVSTVDLLSIHSSPILVFVEIHLNQGWKVVELKSWSSSPSLIIPQGSYSPSSGLAICSIFFKSWRHSLPSFLSCWAQRVSSLGSWTKIPLWP